MRISTWTCQFAVVPPIEAFLRKREGKKRGILGGEVKEGLL
jgi:hypothetical protein